ncbi:MAG: hypothetical protein ACYCPQ_11135 [Elusimicrobiota bacterium]
MRSLISALLAIIFCVGSNAEAAQSARYNLLSPIAGQWDLELSNITGFTGPDSLVQVRENQVQGTPLQYSNLGLNEAQIPTIDAKYWLDSRDAVQFQFRYFFLDGTSFVSNPVFLNGSEIAAGQNVNASPKEYSASLLYERRLRPSGLDGWDLRGRIGVEYTRINFGFNNGYAQTNPPGGQSVEDFYLQELPVPILGLEGLRRICPHWIADVSLQGNWLGNVYSLRQEGGKVYLSQSGFEFHARLLYESRALEALHPFIGIAYYNYYQFENSAEDGNFLRYSFYGPEAGLDWSF